MSPLNRSAVSNTPGLRLPDRDEVVGAYLNYMEAVHAHVLDPFSEIDPEHLVFPVIVNGHGEEAHIVRIEFLIPGHSEFIVAVDRDGFDEEVGRVMVMVFEGHFDEIKDIDDQNDIEDEEGWSEPN